MARREFCRRCGANRWKGEPHKPDCPNAKIAEAYWADRNAKRKEKK